MLAVESLSRHLFHAEDATSEVVGNEIFSPILWTVLGTKILEICEGFLFFIKKRTLRSTW